MSQPDTIEPVEPVYVARHPRRTGFIIFNIAALVVFAGWAGFTASAASAGILGLPNMMLGYGGLAVIALVWIGAWIAWGTMVTSRHLPHPVVPDSKPEF